MQIPIVCRILLAGILLATTLEVEVRAQIVSKVPGPFGWKKSVPLHLILDKGVANDLGLSPETTGELKRLHEQIQADVEVLRRAPANNPQFAPRTPGYVARRPWNDELLHSVRNRYTERINDLLSPEQQERLHQIHLQVQPKPTTDVLLDPGVAKELGLSDKQRSDIYQRHYEVVRAEIDEGKQGRKFTGPRYGQLELEVPEKVLNLLTPEQRQRFEQLGGKPFQPADPETASSDAALSNSETLTLAFDELEADGFLRNALGRYPTDHYREKYSLWMGSCQLMGTAEVGKDVVLTRPVAAFEVLGGREQPFISPQNIILPADGGTGDLLLTFERPVTAVSIVSDRSPETADVIRLLILEPVPTANGTTAPSPSAEQVACRVLALDRKFDNALTAPDNLLSVDLKGKPFHHVLIECITEQEGFDNLRFTRAIRDDQEPSAVPPVIFDWKIVRESQQVRAADDRSQVGATPQTALPLDKPQRILQNQVDLARMHGWVAVKAIMVNLDAAEKERYPGVAALLADLKAFEAAHERKFPPHEWPAENADELLLRNPHFWKATAEVAPGDSALLVIHVGLLAGLGELDQAYNLLQLTRHDDSIPRENLQKLQQILFSIAGVKNNASGTIRSGNAHYDAGRYEEAAADYQKVLAVWPNNAAAHYELGQTLPTKLERRAAEYAQSRRANPLLKEAYQGTYTAAESQKWAKVFPLVKKWNETIVKGKTPASSELLLEFAGELQDIAILETRLHELALFARQIVIGRTGRYTQEDEEFISTSLRDVIDGAEVKAVVNSLREPAEHRLTLFPRIQTEQSSTNAPKAP